MDDVLQLADALNDIGRKHGPAVGRDPDMIHLASSMFGVAHAARVDAVCSFIGTGVTSEAICPL